MLLPKDCRQPVILIDTMEIRQHVVSLTASLAHQGRSFPFFSIVVRSLRIKRAPSRAFLQDLADILPKRCRPILITDGGFESPWFCELEQMGWDYIGRIRGQVKLRLNGKWCSCHQIHQRGSKRAQDLGMVEFPKASPRARRVVLSKKPTSGHRYTMTRRGPGRDSNDIHYAKNAHEPLVLATSLSAKPSLVVSLYKTRMQIEQSFRDLKNLRWGWSLRHCLSRTKQRIELLLLIGAIASVVVQFIGIAAEQRNLHFRHQANTIRHRRTLSFFVLGTLIVDSGDDSLITSTALKQAISALKRKFVHLAKQHG
jgi:hypothetical protein